MTIPWPPPWWPFGREAPAPMPSPDPVGADSFALEILSAHNAIRARHGLPPLAHDAALQGIADGHARAMAAARLADHDRAGDGDLRVRLRRSGRAFYTAGENVAAGYPDIPSVMAGWLMSPSHRANILGDFTHAGCQVALDPSGHPYWCADFGRPAP